MTPATKPFDLAPSLLDIQHVKEDATAEAVRRLQDQLKVMQIEAYNEALNDAQEYITVMASRALRNKFRFGYKRMERFLDELMRLMAEADIKEERQWLKDFGFELVLSDIGDEVKKKGDV